VRLAKRVESLPPYLFVEISRKIAERKAKGEDVVSFASATLIFLPRRTSSKGSVKKRVYLRINATLSPKVYRSCEKPSPTGIRNVLM